MYKNTAHFVLIRKETSDDLKHFSPKKLFFLFYMNVNICKAFTDLFKQCTTVVNDFSFYKRHKMYKNLLPYDIEAMQTAKIYQKSSFFSLLYHKRPYMYTWHIWGKIYHNLFASINNLRKKNLAWLSIWECLELHIN